MQEFDRLFAFMLGAIESKPEGLLHSVSASTERLASVITTADAPTPARLKRRRDGFDTVSATGG
jgi:hypothetical protein